MSQRVNKPEGKSARHREHISHGAKEPGSRMAKGQKSQTHMLKVITVYALYKLLTYLLTYIQLMNLVSQTAR